MLGGAEWINLLNTKVMRNKQPTDLLADPAIASEWLKANQLLTDIDIPIDQPAFEQVLHELVAVRELCSRILSDMKLQGSLTDNVYSDLNNRLERLQLKPSMTHNRDTEKFKLVYEGCTLIDQVAHTLLHSVIDTLNNVSFDRIRKCGNDACILHFVDVSKSGRRRWCSMESCGNRQKAAQFYEKNKKRKA